VADLLRLAKNFEDRAQIERYYETRAFMRLKNELLTTLQNETKQILFLIGDPGTGKSVFLYHIPKLLDGIDVVRYNTPFFEPVDFVKSLISKKGARVKNYSLETLIDQAVKLYENEETLVAIDEAQLLSDEMVELIRILADSKAFWFLLAMHRHESAQILEKPQFRSRPHRIFELQKLDFDEVREYISKELLALGEYTLDDYFTPSLVRRLYKLSRGNFRDLKKLLHRIFLLMDQAIRLGKKGYERPNRCLVTMAAIDGELLSV